MISKPLRVALLSYRSKPHSGGQGIYVRHLSRELAALGHRVEVFSGPPLPELDEGVELTVLPSLDLYRDPDPFRTPRREEFTDSIDVLEWLSMCTGAFPEPLTFSLRAWRHLKTRLGDFDVIHDNQCLGYGLLPLRRLGTPLVATIHHPITVDRDLELAAAPNWKRRVSLRRWYAFTRMQSRVARRLPRLTTVSHAARDEIVQSFGVSPEQLTVIGVGVDTDTFRPGGDSAGGKARIVSVASADVPLKGLPELIEAVAKLRAERDVELVVVGSARPEGAAARSITRLGLGAAVRFVSGISDDELADLFRSATVAAVPSRYEGFSLPAVEAMSCGIPLVVTTAGALPEVTGPDGLASLHVPPGDAGALAAAIGRLLDDEELRRRLGAEGRRRVVEQFTWRRTALRTAEWYAQAITGR
ncbi:glycosyltransferase family 4 protein [Actinoplanes couchii]|uniref:Glycosyl transferase family 1 n=1 Tax=Actinoplanes couchii TaxID=403638 RepID=A0ABQ3XGC3_9ACTN|nr:glycosyltransferase family 4 protein [Actinoplanes couchii]MDR6321035.1 glycosyltransferase involved in cell wall biosynthesis [Actinoplanes couchii]GID57546.1 glycosyl transferase family 1 [Actinoplanes couchii]